MKHHLQKFFKYAALYMSSSVDTITAFNMAKRRVRHKKLQVYISDMLGHLGQGLPFSHACQSLKDGGHLDGVSWSIVSTADKAGSMRKSCEQVSVYMAAAAKIKGSIISSLVYPLGVVTLALSMVLFLISFIFPKIIPLFNSLHADIPPATSFLILISNFLHQYYLYMFVGVIGLFSTFMYSYKTNKKFRFFAQVCVLRLPFIKGIVFAKESQCLALSCGTLMRGGRSLSESLAIARESSGNAPMMSFIDSVSAEIEKGMKMSDGLGAGVHRQVALKKMFEGEWTDLLSVGEMTGTLPQSFAEIAEFYEGRLKEDLELLSRWSEPVALAVSASVILVVAMSVIQPMYAILQYVH